ncbi:MAG: hypothetical protein ABFS56_18710 [Pseudomonadota bacterium]
MTNPENQEQHFAALKSKYQMNDYKDTTPSSPLYFILQKMDLEIELIEFELDWLKEHKLHPTMKTQRIPKAQRTAALIKLADEFSVLKSKYHTLSYRAWTTEPLYFILHKLDSEYPLNDSEMNHLTKRHFPETVNIANAHNFLKLKDKYKATQHQESSVSSPLYQILLNLEADEPLNQSELNWLKEHKLTETYALAQENIANLKAKVKSGNPLNQAETKRLKPNGDEEITTLVQKKHFATLKSKYNVSGSSNQLYTILKKLEQKKRLEPKEFAWLYSEKLFKRESKIFTAYHQIEATYYEQEHKRTGDKWNLANASSHWRSAEQATHALKLTDNLKFDQIKNDRLKSALSTTRGGAFRDMGKLDEAEYCALQAIDYYSNSHYPYTLMGALCYQKKERAKGDIWFDKAIKRGASPKDQETEIKRVIKHADKEERRDIMAHLLKKDTQRNQWVKRYIKALENQEKKQASKDA